MYTIQIWPHMGCCSHLWTGSPQYQKQTIFNRLDYLVLRRDVAFDCILYRICHGECSEGLFRFISDAEFHHRTTRLNSKFHPRYLWDSRGITLRFSRQFLLRTISLWSLIQSGVFTNGYDLGTFKKRAYSFIKDWQRNCKIYDSVIVRGRLSSLTIRSPFALSSINKKTFFLYFTLFRLWDLVVRYWLWLHCFGCDSRVGKFKFFFQFSYKMNVARGLTYGIYLPPIILCD